MLYCTQIDPTTISIASLGEHGLEIVRRIMKTEWFSGTTIRFTGGECLIRGKHIVLEDVERVVQDYFDTTIASDGDDDKYANFEPTIEPLD